VQAGDVIGSGTCGTGCIFELSRTNNAEAYPWLAIGDVVELSAETLGAMRNEVRAGPPLHELRPVR
jgi:2-keto-4-pentenoate hydratase/2-oxohepta-3-ene-1,7-dioic acid hydratase in catechol pathway